MTAKKCCRPFSPKNGMARSQKLKLYLFFQRWSESHNGTKIIPALNNGKLYQVKVNYSLLNKECQDSIIFWANFFNMVMIDITNKKLLNTIINLGSIFVNKFTLSIMTLHNVIYLLFIIYFIYLSIVFCSLCCCATLALPYTVTF